MYSFSISYSICGQYEVDMNTKTLLSFETVAIVTSNDDGVGHCQCSKCNKTIHWQDSYCRHCGRKIVDVTFQRGNHGAGKE